MRTVLQTGLDPLPVCLMLRMGTDPWTCWSLDLWLSSPTSCSDKDYHQS